MVILWILVIYIVGVFYARYLNFLINKMEGINEEPLYAMWFIPLIGPIFASVVLFIVYFETYNPKWLRWFKGEDW